MALKKIEISDRKNSVYQGHTAFARTSKNPKNGICKNKSMSMMKLFAGADEC